MSLLFSLSSELKMTMTGNEILLSLVDVGFHDVEEIRKISALCTWGNKNKKVDWKSLDDDT